MNELLQPGKIVQTKYSGHPCEVERFLGGGGQGEVYRAKWNGKDFALKWYFPHTATPEQRTALENLVQHHRKPSDRFLWPEDIAEDRNGKSPGFGYLMRLREPRFKSLMDLVSQKIDPRLRELVTAALQLADSFHKLHADGLCYRDISFGNAFFDPKTGEILICDNDNVAENRSKVVGVLGTPDFMAPEIVRCEALPSRQTDLFSLSVLLFYMFFTNHPLVGKKVLNIRMWDRPAREKLFGREPLFIFDPTNSENAAVPRAQDATGEAGGNAFDSWPIFPGFMKEKFIKAFTLGLNDCDARVTEGEWKKVLSQLRDGILHCNCRPKLENFFDPECLDDAGVYSKPCWQCKKVPPLPPRLRLNKRDVLLNDESSLFRHHLDDGAEINFESPIAQVVPHPKNPKVFGLRNDSESRWVATIADGSMREIDPGKSIVLSNGTKIMFGRLTGEVCY